MPVGSGIGSFADLADSSRFVSLVCNSHSNQTYVLMKRAILITLIAIGLAQSSRASAVGNLLWQPSTGPSPSSTWDMSTANWYDTNLTSNVTFAQGDSVIFDDSGNNYATVTLSGVLNPSNVVVTATWFDYSLGSTSGGKLTNVYSLTKKGYGTLVLDADCVITNTIVIEEGTLQVGNGASRGTLGTGYLGYTAPITNGGTLAFSRTGTLNFTNDLSGSGVLLITNNGTINMRGNNTMTGQIIHQGAVLDYVVPSNLGSPSQIDVTMTTNNARTRFAGGVTIPTGCPITITSSAGTETSSRASLMSMGGINTINGPIRVGGGASTGGTKPNVNLYVQAATTELVVNSSVDDIDNNPYLGNFFLRGTVAGGIGKLYGTINLPSATLCKDEVSTWTIYSTGNKASETWVNAGRLNLATTDALPVTRLTLNTSLDMAGFDQRVGPLWGSASGLITNSSTASDALLTLTNGGAYSGAIKDNGTTKIALKLLNPGAPITQQLLGDCSYRGATTLDIATAIALGNSGLPNSTPIEMGNGSSLDMSTKADHTFTLGTAQTLKPDGNVHVNGNLVNQGTIECKIGKSGTTVSNDQVVVSSQLTCGGTLKLNLSVDSLDANDSFTLFSAASYSGAFSSINPATPGAGFAWNTNTLTTDGTLRIFSTTRPDVSTEVVSDGTQLHLAWPLDHTGWVLQGQTNTVGGITTNWYDVPGSPLSNEMYMPIDPANGSVFYRLVYRP